MPDPQLTVVTWNVNGFTHRSQPEFLGSVDWDIALLQEVTRKTWAAFRSVADDGDLAFDYLPPLAGREPRYACAVLVRGDLRLESFELLRDMPSPERAAVAKLTSGAGPLWACSWAAPPGVTWGKAAKARQVGRFASWLGKRPGPTLVGIDRNAPRWERHELDHDEWWNSTEPLLYGPERTHDLRDAFRDYLQHSPREARRVKEEFPDGPLAITHVRRGIPCRYDAIYASPEFDVVEVQHHWEDAVLAGSDHALVRATTELRV